jgi:hypothetical protein
VITEARELRRDHTVARSVGGGQVRVLHGAPFPGIPIIARVLSERSLQSESSLDVARDDPELSRRVEGQGALCPGERLLGRRLKADKDAT